jgi:hypothetical protein
LVKFTFTHWPFAYLKCTTLHHFSFILYPFAQGYQMVYRLYAVFDWTLWTFYYF